MKFAKWLPTALCCLPLSMAVTLALSVPARAAVSQEDKELAGTVEEQIRLQRQLERLRATMEVLLGRTEAEGRDRTADLLRRGLTLLDEALARGEAAGAPLTLAERMDASRERLERGEMARAIEEQEAAIQALERLLAILMDRQNLDTLEAELAQLRSAADSLAGLADAEADLRAETRALAGSSADPEVQSQIEAIEDLARRQAELARATAGEEADSSELERLGSLLERLDALLADQITDAGVLARWDPSDPDALAALAEPLDSLRQAAARMGRMASAARSLKEAADETTASSVPTELEARARQLEAAAERAARHARVAPESGAEETAAALARGAEAMSRAAAGEIPAEEAARVAADEVQSLAAARPRPAGELEQVRDGLKTLGQEDDAGAALAREVSHALENLGPAAAAGVLERGVEELRFLSNAMAGSQRDAAQRARDLARESAAQQTGQDAAQASLERAAESMDSAAEAAERSDAPAAARGAQAARESLEEARRALSGARAQAARNDSASQQQSGQQASLAEEARELGLAAERAMRAAAGSLADGDGEQAGEEQAQALESLAEAARALGDGQRAEGDDLERAAELAREQERLREEMMDLARRMREERGVSPAGLDRAAGRASEAAEALQDGDLGAAQEAEQQTEEDLRDALDDLEEEEEAYQRLRQEEVRFQTAQEVTALLEAHREAMVAVQEIDAGRTGAQGASRAQKLRLRRVAREEAGHGARARELSIAIAEEHSRVSAELLERAADDLERIARMLAAEGGWQSGPVVQNVQRRVAESLEWLLEALASEENQPPPEEEEQEASPESQGPPPLVSNVTELKLLRRMELETRRSLVRLQELHPELSQPGAELDPLVLEDVAREASRHGRVTELFLGLKAGLGISAPADETGRTEGGGQ